MKTPLMRSVGVGIALVLSCLLSLVPGTSFATAVDSLFATTVPVNNGWDFEDQAQGVPTSCDTLSTALQRFGFSPNGTNLVATQFQSYALPLNQYVSRVEADVIGGNDTRGAGGCSFEMTTNLPNFVAFTSAEWTEGVRNCRWRMTRSTGPRIGPHGLDITADFGGGQISQDQINSLTVSVKRGSGTRDMRVSGFRIYVTTEANPSNLTVTNVTASAITLTWSAAGGTVTGYDIEFSLNGVNWSLPIQIGNQTSYTHDNLAEQTTYYYRVKARNAVVSSGYTNTASATTKSTPYCVRFFVQPPNGDAVTDLSPAVQVEIVDNQGLRVPDATNAITIAIGNNPGGVILTGGGPIAASAGVATFPNLRLNRPGSGYTLTASFAGMACGSAPPSQSFDIAPGPPDHLGWASQPHLAAAGRPIGPVVRILDAAGNTSTSATNLITITLQTRPCGTGALHGTTSLNAVGGLASFPDAFVDAACAGYTLRASGVGTVDSDTFTVIPGPPARLWFETQPTQTALGRTMTVAVSVQDSLTNRVTSATDPITLTLATNLCSGILAGGEPHVPVGGVATFGSVQVDKPCNLYTLRASADGVPAAFSAPFSIVQFQSTGRDLLAGGFGFDAPDGTCDPHGWVGESMDTVVFAHLSGRFVTTTPPMGTTALWFGADSTSAAAEVSHWVYGTGFGNNWSQRLVSQTFDGVANHSAVLSFDATIDLRNTGGLVDGSTGNEFLAAQVLDASGTWRFLTARYTPVGSGTSTFTAVGGSSTFSCQAFLGADGNESIPLNSGARVRIVVQTDSVASPEDGGVGPGRGAAVVDNVMLLNGVTPVIPTLTFEGTGLQTWSLRAQNGLWVAPGPNASFTRDVVPVAATIPQLKRGSKFGEDDDGDPTCVWAFLAAGDTTAGNGRYARLRSPWLPRYGRDSVAVVTLSARFNTQDQRRAVDVYMLGKNTGDSRPRFMARPTGRIGGSASGDDHASAFQTGVTLTFPADFLGGGPADSLQLVVQVADVAEATAGGTNRPATQLPLLDNFQIVVAGADPDSDGVANVNGADNCPTTNAAGRDANGDGCPDNGYPEGYPTFTSSRRYWAYTERPIHYAFSASGYRTVDGSEFADVRAAFTAWQGVGGASFTVQENTNVARDAANAADGVNQITWSDALTADGTGFPEGVLALTSHTYFTRQTSFNDELVAPGREVDCDIRFNPAVRFSTSGTGPMPGTTELYPVALHEVGHLLGLAHTVVSRATMFPRVGAETATIEDADQSAIASRFPSTQFGSAYGSIGGRLTHGDTSGIGPPLRGARVMALRLDGGQQVVDTSAVDYSDANGDYHLWRLRAGAYAIRVEPSDAFEFQYVDSSMAGFAETNFEPEWWNVTEGPSDSLDAFTPINVAAGSAFTGYDVATNIDNTPPIVTRAQPTDSTVDVDAAISVDFSEPIEYESLKSAFTLTLQGQAILGRRALIDGTRFVFIPYAPLSWSSTYDVTIDSSMTDANLVPLAHPYRFSFTTRDRPSGVAVTHLVPDPAPAGGLLTVTGDGFDTETRTNNSVTFSACTGGCHPIVPDSVAPHTLVVRIPQDVLGGSLTVTVTGPNGGTSGPIPFNLTQDPASMAPGAGATVDLRNHSPRDVALTPDGSWALVAARGGLVRTDGATIDVVPAVPSVGPLESIVIAPATLKAYAVSPDSGWVCEFGADPGHIGTLGQLRQPAIRLGGHPVGVAVSRDGRRAYVTDTERNAVHEIDVSRDTARVLRRFDVTGATITGAIELTATSRWVMLDSRDAGAITLSFVDSLPWNVIQPAVPQPGGHAGSAITPQDDEALFAGGSGGVRSRRWPSGENTIPLGSRTEDVAIMPGGRLALVADPGNSRLAVVSLNAASSTDHEVVGSAYVPGSPTAVALDAFGTRTAVVSAGSGMLTFFPLSANGQLHTLSPAVGSPGDLIGVIAGPAALPDSTKAEMGSTLLRARFVADSSLSIAIPALEQQGTTVAVLPPFAPRSATLPFRIVDPITLHASRISSLVLAMPRDTCGAGANGFAPLRAVLASPRGDVVATVGGMQDLGTCSLDAVARLWQADRSGSQPLGALLRKVAFPGGRDAIGAAFWADGRELWVAVGDGSGGEVRVIDTSNPAGSSFDSVRTLASGLVGHPTAIATDPLGRLAAVAARSDRVVTLLRRDGSVADTIAMGLHSPQSLAFSRDGRTLVVGGEDRAWFYDTESFTLVRSTAPNSGVSLLSTTTHGDRIAGLEPPHTLRVWNLDPAQGLIGVQRASATVPDSIASLVPAPDGASVLACDARRDVLYRFDISGGSVVQRSRPLGHAEALLARSPDGRLLWAGDATLSLTHAPTGPDSVRLYSLVPDSGLALVSGAGQSAAPDNALSQPVRVKVTNGLGNPAAGVLVEFTHSEPGGGAKLDGDTAAVQRRLTDVNGIASVGWTLGSQVGVDTVRARLAPGLPSLLVTANATGADAGTPPVIIATSPPSGFAQPLSASTSLSVTLSQRMDLSDWRATVTANGQTVPGLWSGLDNGRTMVFEPQRGFPFSSAGVLAVPEGVHDVDGDSLQSGRSVAFSIESAPSLAIEYAQPRAVPAGGVVNIVGRGFTSSPQDHAVTVGDRAGIVLHAAPTLLEVQLPADMVAGNFPLHVRRTATGEIDASHVSLDVLPAEPQGTAEARTQAARNGGHSLAIVPGTARAYVVTPSGDNVHVYDLSGGILSWIRTIPVGHVPLAIAMHPRGGFAYVANSGSNDLSVVDLTQDMVTRTVALPGSPISMDVATTTDGEFVLVVTEGDSTSLLTLDGRPTSATLNSIVETTKTTSGTKVGGVVVQDGGRSWLWTDRGPYCYDLNTRAIEDSIPALGSVLALEVDRARRGLLYAIQQDGSLAIADIARGSGTYRQVLSRLTIPGGAAAVKSMPDGTLLVTARSDDQVRVYQVSRQGGFNSQGVATGALVLNVVTMLPTGHGPAGIAVDPGGAFALIANEGEASATRVDIDVTPPMAMAMDLQLDTFDLDDFGRWSTAAIRAPADSLAPRIDLSSLRLADLVPADSLGPSGLGSPIGGVRPFSASFPRLALPSVMPTGSNIVMSATGLVDGQPFVAKDTLSVRRGRFLIPREGALMPAGAMLQLHYDDADDSTSIRRVVLFTVNGGRSWKRAWSQYPRGTAIMWAAPDTLTDSAQVAVVMVDSVTADTSVVKGTLALSELFSLVPANTVGVDPLPRELQFAPIVPAPSVGRAVMRFALTRRGDARLEIFDVQGRLVRTPAQGDLDPGWHEITWYGEGHGGAKLGAGVYFARLRAEGRSLVRRFVWVR